MVVQLTPPLYELDRYLSKIKNADRRLWHYLFLKPRYQEQSLWGRNDDWPIILHAQRLLDTRALDAEIVEDDWLSDFCIVEGYPNYESIRYPDLMWRWIETGLSSPAPWFRDPRDP